MANLDLLVEQSKYYLDTDHTAHLDVNYTWKWDLDFTGSEVIAVHLRSVSIFGIDLPTWQLPKDLKNSIKQSIECKKAQELLSVTP